MSHNVETMAYANEVPWHGLGVQVSDNLTPAEMLGAAGLDWKVDRKALWIDGHENPVGSHFALVRDLDDKVLGICGQDYQPTQNAEVFDFFDKFCKAGDMKMETAGSLSGGKRVWGLAKINGGFMLGGKDEVEGYILLDNPHIWGRSLQILFTPIRVVCNNTLTAALRNNTNQENTFRMSHDRAFDDEIKQQVAEKVGLAMKALDVFKDKAEAYSKFILKLESEADQAAAEIKRIQALKKAKENTVQRLKDTLLAALMVFTEEDAKGIRRYETPLAKLSTRKSQSVEILDEALLPDDFWVIKKEVSKSTISAAIKDGAEVPGAQMKENLSLSIR